MTNKPNNKVEEIVEKANHLLIQTEKKHSVMRIFAWLLNAQRCGSDHTLVVDGESLYKEIADALTSSYEQGVRDVISKIDTRRKQLNNENLGKKSKTLNARCAELDRLKRQLTPNNR